MAQEDYRKLTPAQLKRLGYSPSSERYIRKGSSLAKKNTISRRAFDNESGKYEPWGGRARFERRYKMPSYRYFVEKLGESRGYSRKKIRQILNSPTDRANRAAFRAAQVKKRGGREARDPNGPLAKFLVAIGLRQQGWTFDVGDTP